MMWGTVECLETTMLSHTCATSLQLTLT